MDFVALRGFVFARNLEFVLLRNLLGHRLRAVVEFLKYITLGHCLVANHLGQIRAEGFNNGEEHTTAGSINGIAFHEVEITIGIALVIIVQAVQADQRKYLAVLQPGFGDITQVHARRIAQILDIQAEFFLLH